MRPTFRRRYWEFAMQPSASRRSRRRRRRRTSATGLSLPRLCKKNREFTKVETNSQTDRSEAQQRFAQQLGLDAAHGQRLAVGQLHLGGAAEERGDFLNLVNGSKCAAAEPHEAARIEARFERMQPV